MNNTNTDTAQAAEVKTDGAADDPKAHQYTPAQLEIIEGQRRYHEACRHARQFNYASPQHYF
jgi:hypothetical protein